MNTVKRFLYFTSTLASFGLLTLVGIIANTLQDNGYRMIAFLGCGLAGILVLCGTIRIYQKINSL